MAFEAQRMHMHIIFSRLLADFADTKEPDTADSGLEQALAEIPAIKLEDLQAQEAKIKAYNRLDIIPRESAGNDNEQTALNWLQTIENLTPPARMHLFVNKVLPLLRNATDHYYQHITKTGIYEDDKLVGHRQITIESCQKYLELQRDLILANLTAKRLYTLERSKSDLGSVFKSVVSKFGQEKTEELFCAVYMNAVHQGYPSEVTDIFYEFAIDKIKAQKVQQAEENGSTFPLPSYAGKQSKPSSLRRRWPSGDNELDKGRRGVFPGDKVPTGSNGKSKTKFE